MENLSSPNAFSTFKEPIGAEPQVVTPTSGYHKRDPVGPAWSFKSNKRIESMFQTWCRPYANANNLSHVLMDGGVLSIPFDKLHEFYNVYVQSVRQVSLLDLRSH